MRVLFLKNVLIDSRQYLSGTEYDIDEETGNDLVHKGIVKYISRGIGWKDLIGELIPKSTGAGSPTLTAFQAGGTRWFAYAAGDDGDLIFHMPHDYAVGTNLFIHVHWAHNGTDISGNFLLNLYVTYAKGFSQAPFPAEKTIPISLSNLNITNTPQYVTRVDEVQLSTHGGSATLLDTNTLETDGMIIVSFDMTTIPTITGGAQKPFLFTLDIHYQSDHEHTPNKAPNFYN